ncbi:hypothetical protein [Microbacterium telephonicum]|uniref:Uncharacterized protein n=1 Tax=Microbacterium telephonicum TaxID=1714841 RepID=A0A498CAQ2_9MICO|nr:hypothetical protein [Microbacterium telephonicum]RLK49361.1 hypothetical protein C7474_1506 [Microbacterium telephonicum]
MNTTLLAPQRTAAPPERLPLEPLQTRTLRTRPLDRLALRVALTLLLWSTRPETDRVLLSRAHDATVARENRERAWRDAAHRLPTH